MGEVHPLARPRSVIDPIHGLVRLTDEELALIDTPTFQRLRRIKQNGLLHLVFPAATHSRFEHSIGVLACVDAMLQALILNSEAAKKQLVHAGSAEPGQGVRFSAIQHTTLQKVFRVARLAALVHDVGHGPCSHAFDSFAPQRRQIRRLLKKDPSLQPIRPFIQDILGNEDSADEREPVAHEVMSVLLFAWIWAQGPNNDDNQTLIAVCAVILGGPMLAQLSDRSLYSWLPLIHDLVASAPVDADRMDYVERDSRSCGVTYGIFDRQRLLKSVLCYREAQEDNKAEPHYRMGWKLSGLRAIENFLQARFQLFVQIYYHKTNHALTLMLKELGVRARKARLEFFAFTSLEELADEYAELGDESFLSRLRGRSRDSFVDQPEINSLAQAIEYRQFWRRIYKSHDGHKSAEIVLQVLQDQYPKEPLFLDIQKVKATKDLDTGGALLERGGDKDIYRVRSDVTWTGTSPILKTLEDQERSIARVYLCPEFEAEKSTDSPTERAHKRASRREAIQSTTESLQRATRRVCSKPSSPT